MSKTIYAHTPPYTNETVEFERYTNGVSMRDAADVGVIDYKFNEGCLLYTSPSPRDVEESRMPSSA